MTTASGRPVFDNQNTQSAGARGPLLLRDYFSHEKSAHFNRERIPERVVHAKGSGYGTFTVTHDIAHLTHARLFARFSTVGGEKGSADIERDSCGFALKFYIEDGNWDLVSNNTPVLFVRDLLRFMNFVRTQKGEARSNRKSPTMMWDYWSLNPESLHQVIILMSDWGTPHGYRHMHGFGSHPFSLINAAAAHAIGVAALLHQGLVKAAVVALQQDLVEQDGGLVLRRVAVGHLADKGQRQLGGQLIVLAEALLLFPARLRQVGLERLRGAGSIAVVFLDPRFGLGGRFRAYGSSPPRSGL